VTTRSAAARKKAEPVPKTNIGRRRAANAAEGSEFYQERQQAIIRAAARVFQEKGFHKATISDIAEKLGTDRASVYYYVSSKDELLQRMVREATIKNVTAMENLVASPMRAADKLRLFFVTQMESYRTSYPYLHVFLQEKFPVLPQDTSRWKKEIAKLTERYGMAVHQILQQGEMEGDMKFDLPIEVTVMGLIGMVNWAHRWYKPEGRLTAQAIGEGFADIALKGLLTTKGRSA
jgi:AcrR family transcriptional regulator